MNPMSRLTDFVTILMRKLRIKPTESLILLVIEIVGKLTINNLDSRLPPSRIFTL